MKTVEEDIEFGAGSNRDLTEKQVNIEIQPISSIAQGEFQLTNKEEVLKRIANFKQKSSDFIIEPIPKMNLDCSEFCWAFVLNFFLHVCCGFLTLPFGFYTVSPKQAVIFQIFGKITRVEIKPGLYFSFILIGRELTEVSMAIQTLQIDGSSVPDLNGSPMKVSAIVNYIVTDPTKATFAVVDLKEFITNQAQEVVRNVCSQFPYRDQDKNKVSLLNDSRFIGVQLREILQVRCHDVGVDVTRMELMEFSYHVEVAQSLLQVQQAQAKIDARTLIVEGSVRIVQGAIQKLEASGIELTLEDRADMAKKLMVITCSDHGSAMPVLQV